VKAAIKNILKDFLSISVFLEQHSWYLCLLRAYIRRTGTPCANSLFYCGSSFQKTKKARNEYLKKLTRVRSKTNKIKRADEFCLGWSCTVVDKLNLFINTDNEQKAIDNYVANLNWGNNLKTVSRGGIKKSRINDFLNGRQAGTGVEIQNGIEGQENGICLLG
jgi:hypothetical protein